MLKSNIIWPTHKQFKSNSDNEPIDFFSSCLTNSFHFDLMLGFFSSSAIRVLSSGFAIFLYNGGKMRLIINNILSSDDKETLIRAKENENLPFFDLSNIEELKKTLSKKDEHFFNCIAWLIAEKRIDIKVVSPKGSHGICHTKFGVFKDGVNTVGFNGSCNFSKTALLYNIESIDSFTDWDGDISKAKINNTKKTFDKTFSGEDVNVNYVDAEDIIESIYNEFGNKDLKDLLDQEELLITSQRENQKIRPTVQYALEKAQNSLYSAIAKYKKESERPKFPYPTGPREYQIQAFESWKDNDQKGIFAMATGTGKTVTALNCLLEIYNKLGYYKAIILVPTITLVNQWEEECLSFNFTNIIKVYSKEKWRNKLSGVLIEEKVSSKDTTSYIIISTYASYVRQNVFDEINKFDQRCLFIADEAHNMGAKSLLSLLPRIKQKRRIGLSATPKRQYDEVGNAKINEFFNNNKDDSYTFEYSMKEAIEKGVLSRYFYYPHIVRLTGSEMSDYIDLSKKIAGYYNFSSESFKKDEILTRLLLKRKRIIHKAYNKQEVFASILKKHFSETESLKYTFVYVPEGNEPDDYYESDYYITSEDNKEDKDSIHLIDLYTKIVKDIDDKITVSSFISSTDDKDSLLELFTNGSLHVLTSMKCLDEGVDVPRAELAVFCASTGNPRQFIQRRGRILRKHPDKKYAVIHDLVVIPEIDSGSDSYKLERSLLKTELKRVNNFAELAENSSHTVNELFDIMSYYNLNLYKNE